MKLLIRLTEKLKIFRRYRGRIAVAVFVFMKARALWQKHAAKKAKQTQNAA